jgi:hypothetical protein
MPDDLPRRDFLRCGSLAALPVALGAAALGAADSSLPAGSPRPEDFGAVGDGKADDTAALQRAADASRGGLQLTLGRVYLIDKLLVPGREGWTLDGNGATLRKRDDGDNYALVVGEDQAKNNAWAGLPIPIRNLRLDGAKVGAACCGMAMQNWNSRYFNLAVENMSGDGIRLSGTTRNGTVSHNPMANNWIQMVTVSACGGHGIHIADKGGGHLTDWYLGGGWIYDNGGWGIWADECAGAQIGPQLHLYSNKGGGLHGDLWSIGTVFQGIYFEEGQTCHIPGGWRPGIIEHCWFVGNARLEIGFDQGGGINKRAFVHGCQFQGDSHIMHLGAPDRIIEVMGCLFDTADPLRKTRGGTYHATRCWADKQERLIDGPV